MNMFHKICDIVSQFISTLWSGIRVYIYALLHELCRRIAFKVPKKRDILHQLQNSAWCQSPWCMPRMNEETRKLIQQCLELPPAKISNDVNETIKRSNEFRIPFPIESIRLQSLQETRPLEDLKRNIVSTYPLVHERVLLLMARFLVYKRKFGSTIEKSFYKDMTIPDFVNRILMKRAVAFYGPLDRYKLMTGEKGIDGWETVGTLEQKPPLILENCLSYDEMKLSAMVFVSGYTEFINNGTRYNAGVVNEENIEKDGIIIGLIGTRLHRKFKIDYEDIYITDEQNIFQNGYGEKGASTACSYDSTSSENQWAKDTWRQIWTEFFQVHNYTYEELMSYADVKEKLNQIDKYTKRFIKKANVNRIFDNEVYHKRLAIPFDCILLEANNRAKAEDKTAYLNVVGIGLGAWIEMPHQIDVFILSFLERIRYYLANEMLNHVTDVNFAFIKPSSCIEAFFTLHTKEASEIRSFFFENERHPYGGINVQFENREPSAKLHKEHTGKLLVTTYAWNGNAHPGNDFWLGNLTSSGDPAAACSTQVSELHNAHVNNHAVCAKNLRVAGRYGVLPLREYCKRLL